MTIQKTRDLSPGFQVCIQRLKELESPEVLSDDMSLGIYATDASLYQVTPLAVVIPKTEKDVVDVVGLANEYKVPILPRGSATSLAGQTTNEAIVIDFTKYLNHIISIDIERKTATVQPGVVRDQLNAEVKKYNLHFAPDPATSSRATIGGMIANNSSGTKSIKYGKTIDHIVGLKVLLADGTILNLSLMDEPSWESKASACTREGEIYHKFREQIFHNTEEILRVFPKVLRSVQGYPLDYFTKDDKWNLAWLFAGSEGSLGIILEATIRLEPVPQHKAVTLLHYTDRLESIGEVKEMVKFHPAAIEMLDYHVFMKSKNHPLTKDIHAKIIHGEPASTMAVEFFSDKKEEVDTQLNMFLDWASANSKSYAYPVFVNENELENVWDLRKNGLGLIMGDPNGRKPIPFIEDMAIPLENLAEYISDILRLCEINGVETILYAHASVGVLHVRPALDLMDQHDIDLMKKISDEVFTLVKKYGGAWSGEHGDGRNRGHKLKEFFGDQMYQCLKNIKYIFDPENLMNPNIIIDVPPMDQNLRYGPDYKDDDFSKSFYYHEQHSFEALVHNCSGVGACRNHTGGTMCPSFRATKNEKDSTRGRANILRLAMSGQLGDMGLTHPSVLEALDLCLSCKACKTECPSNVDMSKLKSEVLQKYYDKNGVRLREKLLLNNEKISRFSSGRLAPIVNTILQSGIFKNLANRLLKIHKKRTLPLYTHQTLNDWFNERKKGQEQGEKIVLFNDCYLNYHDTHIGKSAIQLLESCGYDVELLTIGCCQRPRISNGFLKEAKMDGLSLITKLQSKIDQGIPVVVCEPSCHSAIKEDLPDLINEKTIGKTLKQGVFLIDEFLGKEWDTGKLKGQWRSDEKQILLHGHCHQKASTGLEKMKLVLSSVDDLKYEIPDSGCCGMAGSFGYEKEHYEVSKTIAENVLIPAINKSHSSTTVIANGFSCRHQIADFSTKKPKHWVECVRFVKENNGK